MRTILLLTAANVFMTIAWYGHLKVDNQPMWKLILVSWGIALVEYCFQVPANRIGYRLEGFNAVQLKTIQEVISLTTFAIFAWWYLGEQLRWNHLVGFALLVLAVVFVFRKWD
jgi:uncharacterized protein (DUF486 family)